MELDDRLQGGVALVDAPAGAMELWIDKPQGSPVAMAIVAHQHPSQDGHACNEIPALLAEALCETDVLVLRPNFRGVGRSDGAHDHGEGETEDMCWLVDAAQRCWRMNPVLVGFSFGAFVMARVAARMLDAGQAPAGLVLAATPVGVVHPGRPYDTPHALPDALVIHGEEDDRVPLGAVLDWARPDARALTVVPGADHFFAGRLDTLRSLVVRHVRAAAGSR